MTRKLIPGCYWQYFLLKRTNPLNQAINGTCSVRSFSVSKTLESSLVKPSSTKVRSLPQIAKLAAIGFGVGAILSSGYMYDFYKKIKKPLLSPSTGGEYILKDRPPSFQPARVVHSPTDRTGLKITMYQYQTCPFCCKVRAYLDYYGFSYEVIEVNSVTRSQTKWTTYRKVPFLVIEQPNSEKILQLRDSSMIISALQSFLVNKSKSLEEIVNCFPTVASIEEDGQEKLEIMNRYFLMYGQHPPGKSKEDIAFERKWRKWTDDVYVHMLSPNVYRTMEESFQAFSWFSKTGNWEEHFAAWERHLVVYLGSFVMYFIGKKLKKRHHLKDDVRLSFYDETNYWLKCLKQKRSTFMGGDEPSLSDLNVYGVLMAIEGCDAFQDLLKNTNVKPWFYSMKDAVEAHGGSKYIAERGQV